MKGINDDDGDAKKFPPLGLMLNRRRGYKIETAMCMLQNVHERVQTWTDLYGHLKTYFSLRRRLSPQPPNGGCG